MFRLALLVLVKFKTMKKLIKDFNSGKFGYDSNDNRKGKKTKSTKRNRRYEDEWEFMEWS